ncbi:MAG TPA: response regulator [Gaiellales bacterium]|nr:response regulator [Gaiellales bacterium]
MDTSLPAPGSDRPLRVLIADDHVGLRAMIAEALRSNGYDVDEVGNGGLALEAIRRGDHRVAIVDVRMPVLDGLAVAARVREEGLACRVIVISVVDDPETRRRVAELGAAFHRKPFRLADLLADVRDAGTVPQTLP